MGHVIMDGLLKSTRYLVKWIYHTRNGRMVKWITMHIVVVTMKRMKTMEMIGQA